MTPPRWVLDTNVVIDWLMLNHPFMDPLRCPVGFPAVAIATMNTSSRLPITTGLTRWYRVITQYWA